jgi:WD40 repeat protein
MLTTALKGHKSQISKVAFMSNNKYLASASWDCTARIWALDNLNRDEPLKIYTGTYPIL